MKLLSIILFLVAFIFHLQSCTDSDTNVDSSKRSFLISTYLTFQDENTNNSITINLFFKNKVKNPKIYYGKTSGALDRSMYESMQNGAINYLEKANRTIVSFKLLNLESNQIYYFIAGEENSGFEKEYKFKTLPSDSTPIRLVQGGDMGNNPTIADIISSSLEDEPQVILVGGDIAYADGNYENTARWDNWFNIMNSSMVTENGFLIPLILAIGNHEINQDVSSNKIPFYYNLFPQNNSKSYFRRYLGTHSVLYILDTGHDYPHGGEQATWLENAMLEDENIVNKIALYHVPLYPSHRNYDEPLSIAGRSAWLNSFDSHHLKLALENHDHTLKRTHLLKGDIVVPENGVLYLGDGCWGRATRTAESRWYLNTFLEKMHVWNILLESNKITGKAVGVNGNEFDSFILNTDKQTSYLE